MFAVVLSFASKKGSARENVPAAPLFLLRARLLSCCLCCSADQRGYSEADQRVELFGHRLRLHCARSQRPLIIRRRRPRRRRCPVAWPQRVAWTRANLGAGRISSGGEERALT